MNREYHKWWSPRLERDMELLVFGHGGTAVLVFPTRVGRFYEYENMGMVERLRPRIEAGDLQLFCVDSIDSESFYCFWAHPHGRIHRHLQYESYLLEEVLPLVRLLNTSGRLMTHGCSLGAFHAANFSFRHPNLVQKLVAFSGRYDLTLTIDTFKDLFDGYSCDEIYFNTPTQFLPGLTCEARLGQLRAMEITLVIGVEDPFLANNEQLSRILWDKGIRHRLHLWEGRAHRPSAWREMAAPFLTPYLPQPLG